MPISAGTSNLYFDRDTKLFVGEQLGRSIGLARATVTTAGVINLTKHGLEIGSRVIIPVGNVASTGLSKTEIFYVSKQDFTADTFRLVFTLKFALEGSNPKNVPIDHVFGSDAYMMALDQYNTVGTATDLGRNVDIAGATTATNIITKVGHTLLQNQPIVFVAASGVGANPVVGTVYYVSTANHSSNTFSIAASLATIGTPLTVTGTFTTGSLIVLSEAYGTAGSVVISGLAPNKVMTFLNFPNKFATGDTVIITGITTNPANLTYSGVHKLSGATANQFQIFIGDGSETIINLENIRVSKTVLWELPILKGYSMSQSTATSEVTLNEFVSKDGLSRRGRQMFTTAMNPTEWSFDTYARPYKTTNHYSLEEPLWVAFASRNAPDVSGVGSAATTDWFQPNQSSSVARSATDVQYNFSESNGVLLGTLDLYFVLGAARAADRNYSNISVGGETTIYMVRDAVVNEASISFDVDGITQVSWSGLGSSAIELGFMNATDAASRSLTSANFIRNKLTTVSLIGAAGLPTNTTYDLTITSGNITFSNNISYLTPDTIGLVNKPLGHVSGTRTISGSFTCYLDEKSNGPIDLFQNMAQIGATTITSSFGLDFYIGGGVNNNLTGPGVQIKMGQVHLEIPTMSFDDVLSLEANFHALPSTTGGTDEVTYIKYKGV
jgi:hypothetical protein